MKRIPSLVLAAVVAGCATKPVEPPPVPAEQLVDHEGDSPQTAVPVPENAPEGGTLFENDWLVRRYGPVRRLGGGTGMLEERRYDVVKIELPNGEKVTVYFDITENWKKQLQQ